VLVVAEIISLPDPAPASADSVCLRAGSGIPQITAVPVAKNADAGQDFGGGLGVCRPADRATWSSVASLAPITAW
jgi:hypothetical protein